MSEQSDDIVKPIKRGRGRPKKIIENIEPVESKPKGRPKLAPELKKKPKPRKPRNSPNPTGRPKKYSDGMRKKEDGTYDFKEYYTSNKAYLQTKIECSCGSTVARQFLNNHKKTDKHIRKIELIK